MAQGIITFEQFHEAVGSGLSKWALVEDAFRNLFSRLVICAVTGGGMLKANPDGHWVLGNVFHSSTNFRARIELIDQIFRFLIQDAALLAEWNAVKNKATRLYPRRNILAHGMVWGNASEGALCIGYSIFDEGKRDVIMKYQQVCATAPSFQRYAERVDALAIAANNHLASRSQGNPIRLGALGYRQPSLDIPALRFRA